MKWEEMFAFVDVQPVSGIARNHKNTFSLFVYEYKFSIDKEDTTERHLLEFLGIRLYSQSNATLVE